MPEWQPYLKPITNSTEFSIDLLSFIKDQLLDAGVTADNMEVSEVDTATDLNFYSHYRAKKTGEAEGRFATVIALK